MSVQTEADKKLDEARVALDAAYRALHAIVIDKCSGHEHHRDDARHAFLAVQDLILNPPIAAEP